jgi:hypothetical protein
VTTLGTEGEGSAGNGSATQREVRGAGAELDGARLSGNAQSPRFQEANLSARNGLVQA